MSWSHLVATSPRPSLGHVVYIHTSTFYLLSIRAYTSDRSSAEFKLNRCENFEN